MLFLRVSTWLEHPMLRYVLAASWPAAQGCALIGFSTGWFWRYNGLAFGWRRARVSAVLGVARA